MYYIHDLYENKITAYKTQSDLMRAWGRICGYKPHEHNEEMFDELNVTGKDTYTDAWIYESRLRRYQVLDNDFRSIDIREWSKETWTRILDAPHITVPYIGRNGHKQHTHRAHGPSFRRNDIRNFVAMNDEENSMKCDRPEITTGSAWYYYDKVHHRHYSCSKCWKDQCKARHQWQRHKRKETAA